MGKESSNFLYHVNEEQKDHKDIGALEKEDQDHDFSSIDSTISNGSSSSAMNDDHDDASSSSNSCSSSFYDLSELMSQLPIKRGLSKFYNGKSESFTSLSSVTTIDDLPKKQTPYRKNKMLKSCKSYGGGLESYKLYTLPKASISKKSSFRKSLFPSSCSRKGNFVNRPPSGASK